MNNPLIAINLLLFFSMSSFLILILALFLGIPALPILGPLGVIVGVGWGILWLWNLLFED
jgi:hypothetical protein